MSSREAGFRDFCPAVKQFVQAVRTPVHEIAKHGNNRRAAGLA